MQEAGIVIITLALNDSLKLLSRPKISAIGSFDLRRDYEAETMIRKEIEIFLKNKARELNLNEGFGLNFLRKKKKKADLKETKVIGEIQKSLRSRLLKIFEDLMGKRPALEIEIMMIN